MKLLVNNRCIYCIYNTYSVYLFCGRTTWYAIKKELIFRVIEQENLLKKLANEILEQDTRINYLQHQVGLFQKALFGNKKETHQAIIPLEQTQIAFAEKIDLDLPQDIEQQQITYHRKKAKKKREASDLLIFRKKRRGSFENKFEIITRKNSFSLI